MSPGVGQVGCLLDPAAQASRSDFRSPVLSKMLKSGGWAGCGGLDRMWDVESPHFWAEADATVGEGQG